MAQNIILNLQGTDDELLKLFAMCYSFCLTSEVQTGTQEEAGMLAQIKTQVEPKCKRLIEDQQGNWPEFLKQLEKPIRDEISKLNR